MKKGLLFSLPLFLTATLCAEEAAPARQQNMYQTFLMIGLALVFFYLILWRPEQKRRKKMAEQRSKLSKGDRVTAMGIVGTISTIKDTTVILKMVDGNKIEVVKAAITEVQPAPKETTQSETPAENTDS